MENVGATPSAVIHLFEFISVTRRAQEHKSQQRHTRPGLFLTSGTAGVIKEMSSSFPNVLPVHVAWAKKKQKAQTTATWRKLASVHCSDRWGRTLSPRCSRHREAGRVRLSAFFKWNTGSGSLKRFWGKKWNMLNIYFCVYLGNIRPAHQSKVSLLWYYKYQRVTAP